jgi:hypothetical protein
MKPFQILHIIFTIILLGMVLVFAGLLWIGILEVRIPDKTISTGNQAAVKGSPTPRPEEVKARMLVLRGAKAGMKYPIYEGRNILGRADQQPVDIDLELLEAPGRIWSTRQHAVITCKKNELVIEDLNSTNGTYVNRKKLHPLVRYPLKGGDIIQIGEVQFKVLVPS